MTIANRVHLLQQTINKAAMTYQRNPESIHLMAVSKGQTIRAIEEAFSAGITEFGENYWQEARVKLKNLQKLPITWHFIGPLQSNKAAEIARHFSWVHSVSREKVARLLSEHRPRHLPPLNVCIQVHLDTEENNKSGVAIDELPELVRLVSQLPGLALRGLMAIPRPRPQEEQQYNSLLRLSRLLQHLNQQRICVLDTLSMGMSDDLVPAIAAGSTFVRIGRAIFGKREYS